MRPFATDARQAQPGQSLRLATIVALSFALGALVDAGLTWRLAEREIAAEPPVAIPVDEGVRSETSGTAGVVSHQNHLAMPVDGIERSALHDSFSEARGAGRAHEALDIMAPRGTAIRAVEGGTIVKLFASKAGGLTIYQFDPSSTFSYYYAHLDRYAAGLHEGQPVKRGDLVGYVGSTGNASPDAPHLHFAVFKLGRERQWWNGEPVNPYPLLR